MARQSYIYILTNKKYGTLYIGVTNNLSLRIWQHKNKINEGFTKRYNLSKLVYYESCGNIGQAIHREKQLKGWNRSWKIKLIEDFNPQWLDLYDYLT